MLERLLVRPGAAAGLAERDPADRLGLEGKKESAPRLEALLEELSSLQTRLWAEGSRALLLVLQGLDASGKDGTVRSVFSGVNPQGVRVVSFKAPAANELAHDYLWRIHALCPARGEIGIFNRSHYEDIATVRVLRLAPGGRLAPPCRSHPSVRAAPHRRGHGSAKGLPQSVAGGAARALPGAPGRSGKALEVPFRRSRHARPLGRLRRRLRGGDHRPRPTGRPGTSSLPTATGFGTSPSPSCSWRCCAGSTRSRPSPSRSVEPLSRITRADDVPAR